MSEPWVQITLAVLDLLKAALWPAASVILLGFRFRAPLSTVIASLERRAFQTPFGSAAALPQQEGRGEGAVEAIKAAEEGAGVAVVERNTGAGEAQLTVQTLQAEVLRLRYVAFFEATYGRIFGSQIVLLNMLVGADQDGGLDQPSVEAFFVGIGRAMPVMATYPLQNYLEWLQGRGLIVWDGTTNKWRIADLGRHFLSYMAAEGLRTDARPG